MKATKLLKGLLAGLLMLDPSSARAQEKPEGDATAIDDLRARIEELEAKQDERDADQGWGSWTEHVRLSGIGQAGFFTSENDGYFDDDTFKLWDARLFVEADLGRDVTLGEATIFRDIGVLFEVELARIANIDAKIREMYVDFQGVADSEWINFQFGRFQIPVGENYLRFGQGYVDNPLISNPIGTPWYIDEGVRFYGGTESGEVGYVASVSDGDSEFIVEGDPQKQLTLKLWADPLEWLHLSVSGLTSGRIGTSRSAAQSAVWLGEMPATAFGLFSGVPNVVDGVEVPDGPGELDGVRLVEADAVLTLDERARLWLAYGGVEIDSDGPGIYDRDLRYWIAELILRGGLAAESLEPFWLAFRANGYGTYDSDEGYLLDFRFGSSLGYDMESLEALSVGIGWNITENVAIKAEYTLLEADLVSGVSEEVRGAADDIDFFAFVVSAHF